MTENNKDEFIEIARIKEEFIANASHELKTPIASVRLAAESALTSLERDDGMTKTFLEQILRDSDRMNELISDLLDLSDLFKSVINGLFNFRRLLKILKSSEVRFSDPSSKNSIRLHSLAAIHACSEISFDKLDSSFPIPPVSIIKLLIEPSFT